MGTGIVSVALLLDGMRTLSRILLVLAAGAWLVLLTVAGSRLAFARGRFLAEARSPGGLTAVAASTVLGTRVLELGWTGGAIGLLALAAIVWLGCFATVARRLPARANGEWFMLTVATEGVAVLAAAVGSREHAGWLSVLGLAFAVAGVAAYPLVLARFDRSEFMYGRGDHWVAGGSLAISALAFAELANSGQALAGVTGALRVIAFVVWLAAIAWLPVLLVAEAWRPRPRYTARRWATVFPLGMYAACSFAVATLSHAPVLADFARVWVWVAVAAWALLTIGLLRRVLSAVWPAAARSVRA
jgi:tellurite resistance protein TehA-like permease